MAGPEPLVVALTPAEALEELEIWLLTPWPVPDWSARIADPLPVVVPEIAGLALAALVIWPRTATPSLLRASSAGSEAELVSATTAAIGKPPPPRPPRMPRTAVPAVLVPTTASMPPWLVSARTAAALVGRPLKP